MAESQTGSSSLSNSRKALPTIGATSQAVLLLPKSILFGFDTFPSEICCDILHYLPISTIVFSLRCINRSHRQFIDDVFLTDFVERLLQVCQHEQMLKDGCAEVWKSIVVPNEEHRMESIRLLRHHQQRVEEIVQAAILRLHQSTFPHVRDSTDDGFRNVLVCPTSYLLLSSSWVGGPNKLEALLKLGEADNEF